MQTEDFASTALLRMISAELKAQGFNAPEFNQFEGKTERSYKQNLLNAAFHDLGPASLLAIGQGLQRLAVTPMAPVLLAADSGLDLLHRWQRMQRYFHGQHRVTVLLSTDRSLALEHRSVAKRVISAGENLFVVGLLAEILKTVGCQQLRLTIGSSADAVIDAGMIVESLADSAYGIGDQSSHLWEFSWSNFKPSAAVKESTVRSSGSVTDKVGELLLSDLAKPWRVAVVAERLGMSTRSLQRSFTASGSTFQQCLRCVRADKAAQLLKNAQNTAITVGYTCGYSDQAHFSREFKLRFNITPAEYATVTKDRDQ